MKKAIALLLALVLAMSCAGCGSGTPDATEPSITESNTPESNTPTVPHTTVDNPVSYFQMSISYEDGTYVSLNAYDDGMGMAYVDYMGQIRKVTTMDPAVLHAMVAEMENAGLEALNGAHVEEEGMESASMYVAFADESYWGADYMGSISQEFLDAYAQMEAWFTGILADVPEYVPQPVVMGDVDAGILAEMMAVLELSGLEPLDQFYITGDVYSPAVSGAEGIAAMAECGPMMSSTAYSFTVVELEDAAKIDGIRRSFAGNLDWNRWVCVSASRALIARKDNMVLCMMGGDSLYTMTARAVEAAGWTDIETFEKD